MNKIVFHSILFAALLLICNAIPAHAQLLVNRGATITIKPGAQMVVNGDTENRSGEIRVEDRATVLFNGFLTIRQGGLYLLLNSLATVRRNLELETGATCWRYAPGSLVVDGTIINDGDLTNEGEIVIGRP